MTEARWVHIVSKVVELFLLGSKVLEMRQPTICVP